MTVNAFQLFRNIMSEPKKILSWVNLAIV